MEVEPKPNLTLGEFLQKTREKKGWNVEYIAEQLKLKQSTVKALEANNYNEIGGMVYVKGYLRSYAKLLNLNIDKALDQLHAEHLDASPISTSAATATAQTLKPLGSFLPKKYFNVGLIVILCLLLIILVFAWYRHHAHTKMMELQAMAAVASPTPINTEGPKINLPVVVHKHEIEGFAIPLRIKEESLKRETPKVEATKPEAIPPKPLPEIALPLPNLNLADNAKDDTDTSDEADSSEPDKNLSTDE